jgi:hypothetical protein
MLGGLAQADITSLQTPFIVFSILILAALIIGAFSYVQMSNKLFQIKDELRKAHADLKKAGRWQRKYARLRKLAQKNEGMQRAMKSAMEGSRISLYSVELESKKIKFGKNIDEVLGLEPGEAKKLDLDKYDVYRSYIHPEDVAAVDLPSGLDPTAKNRYSNYYRLMLPGGMRWIKSSGEVVARSGKLHRIVGFIQDIGDLKGQQPPAQA